MKSRQKPELESANTGDAPSFSPPFLSLCVLFSFQDRVKEDEPMPWPGTLAVVHSYLAHKTGKGNVLYLIRSCLSNAQKYRLVT